MIEIIDKKYIEFIHLCEEIGVNVRIVKDILQKSDTIDDAIGEITCEFDSNDERGKRIADHYVGCICRAILLHNTSDASIFERIERDEPMVKANLILELAEELAYADRSYRCMKLRYCCEEKPSNEKGGEQ